MSREWAVAVVLASMLAAAVAEAIDRTPVAVRFVLQHPDYQAEFTTAEQAWLAREVVARLSARLRDNAGFLGYVDGTASYVLTVRLDGATPAGATTWARETGFHIELTGPGIQPGTKTYVPFRTAQASGPLRPPDRMLAEIHARLRDDDLRGPVRTLLGRVPIATAGYVWNVPPNPGWVLPHTKAELCMESDSRLVVDNEVPFSGGKRAVKLEAQARDAFEPETQTPDNYRLRLFSEATDPARFTQELGAMADRVSVKAVYVTDYKLGPCDSGGSR